MSALSVLAVLWAWSAWDPDMLATVPLMIAGPVLVFAAASAVTALLWNAKGAAVVLVWLAALDLGIYGLSYSAWPHSADFESYLAAQSTPPGEPADRFAGDLARFDEPSLRIGDQALLAGWQRIDGYLGLEPQRQLDYRQLPALRAAGVRWVARTDTSDKIVGLSRHDARWLEVPDPLPRVRCVTKMAVDRQARSAVAGLPLERIAVVEQALDIEEGTPGRAAISVERPGMLEIAVETPTRQLLIVADSFHPGWQATVDGQPTPVVRANGDFLGVVVPAGRHDVTLRFNPPSLRGGWALSLLGLVLASGLYIGRAVWVQRTRLGITKDLAT
jgi:hypothetical protein